MSNELHYIDEFRICITSFKINEFTFEKGNMYNVDFIVDEIYKKELSNRVECIVFLSDNFRTIHEYRKIKIEDINNDTI